MKKTHILTIIRQILAVLLCTAFAVFCSSQRASSAPAESFFVDISMSGGSGKAKILSPVEILRTEEGMTAALVWSSENYDYMIVGGVRYDNENAGGKSTFHIPVGTLDEPLAVIADTVAMSTPHEIEYVITWGDLRENPLTQSGTIETPEEAEPGPSSDGTKETEAALKEALEQAGLSPTGTLLLQYAAGFAVTYYGDYASIRIPGSGMYLLVPEGADVPAGLPDEIVLLKKPLINTYLVSTSAMDLVNCCGALSAIRLSGTKATDWYIPKAREAMEKGAVLYAGKYSAPDYERILGEGCRLAIENTMIFHEPAAKAKLEELGIPVLVETSSYEPHPLGRLEWVKLYGLLFDHPDEAQQVFETEAEHFLKLSENPEDTGLKAAFFHITGGGLINVRKPGDYITSMIRMAGGHYALENAGEGSSALSSMNMQMEDFYAQARDADILIYNSTIGGEIGSVAELTRRNPLFADFKAVREGQVYCTERSLFQEISKMADFLQDLHDIFHHLDREYTFINRLE